MSTFRTPGPIGNAAALRLFEHLAASTWGWLADARRLGLGFSEDTVSDLAMLEIARDGSSGVDVRRVSKKSERLVGFDWLWVVSRPGRLPTIYVVQAKKLKLDRSQAYSYGRLRYPAGSRYQMDALQDFADWIGAVPMYCFYNNVDLLTAQMHWNCRVQLLPDVPQLGCTLAPLDVVRPVHDSRGPKGFRSIHWRREALPWRCLFHPTCIGSSLGDGRGMEFEANNKLGKDRALEFLSAQTPDDEGPIDWRDLVNQLGLDDLVRRYATGSFVPIPDRIVSLTLED